VAMASMSAIPAPVVAARSGDDRATAAAA
jgi:hypothetical protein